MDMERQRTRRWRQVNNAGFTIHSGVYKARPDAMCVMHTHTRAGAGHLAAAQRAATISQDVAAGV